MQAQELSGALSVLSAMVTPAVLILACSSLVLATSSRLVRAVDRARSISERVADLAREEERTMLQEERTLLNDQLGRAARRARLLTRAMTALYMALGIFVGTSVSLGVVSLFGLPWAWMSLALGLAGVALLFYASVLLIVESRIALTAVYDEMDFVQQVGERYAPPANLAERTSRRRWRRLR